MPIKAYIGLPRAGKTYEVVCNVILPALRQGRRVISNIAGLNYEAFCQILFAEGLAQEKIGKLILIEHEKVTDSFFWRCDTDSEYGTETFIQPGDLIALDEIWRFWKKRGDIHPRAQNFFRTHGHMPHPETGLICEVALISQSLRDINENIRDVLAETYQMVKNSALGSDKSYIVHIYSRGSTSKDDFIRTLPPRFYNPEYFPLYKSHSQKKDGGADAVEDNPDDRGNILKGAFFKYAMPLSVLLLIAGIWQGWKFFHPDPKAAIASKNAPAASAVPASTPAKPTISYSSTWRLIGYYRANHQTRFLLGDGSGRVRFYSDFKAAVFQAGETEIKLPDGDVVTNWTGSAPGQEKKPGIL